MTSATVRLGDMCDLVTERVKPGARPDALYLGLEHLAPGRLVRIGGGQASEMRSNTSAFRPGDVLYGKLRPYLDKAVLADAAGVCTTELLVLRAKSGVEPRFLAAIVHAPNFLEYAVTGTTGIQHPRTSWAHIREFEVPALAPDEQRRMADLLWLVQEAIDKSEELLSESQTLKRAAMRTLFTRGLRGEPQRDTEIGPVPESWKLSPIGNHTQQVQYGLSIRGSSQGRYPILRMNCQQDGKVILRNLQYVDLDDETFNAYRVRSEDLLFNRTNSLELVGRTAIVGDDIKAVFASYLVRIAVGDELSPPFLNHVLNWEDTQNELKKLASRSVSQANISAGKLKKFRIAVPDLDEQREITALIDAIDRKVDLHRRKCAVVEALFKTLLHKLMAREVLVEKLNLAETDGAVSAGGRVT